MKRKIESESKKLLEELINLSIELFPTDKHKGVAHAIIHGAYIGLSRMNKSYLDELIADVNKYASFSQTETKVKKFSELVNLIESLQEVLENYEPKTRRV